CGRVALLGLGAAALLSLAALSPWPRWDGEAKPGSRDRQGASLAAPDRTETLPDGRGSLPQSTDETDVSLAAARAFVGALLEPPETLPVTPSNAEAPRSLGATLSWGAILAGALLALGLGRFVVGWLLIARLRRRSRAVENAELTRAFDRLRQAAGVRGPVELRETDALSTAAAVGWRRPCVLLPADPRTGWRSWTSADRDAVLAHELAHVAGGDAFWNLLAQSALLTQFYHPLSHWLAGRVRGDQELAADACAAELVGGRAAYLKSLAAVALTADPGPDPSSTRGRFPLSPARLSSASTSAAWPARAFLPSRRTLHERVEMLRRTPVPRSRLATRTAGPLAAVGVLAVAVLASGFRPAPAAE
ncbi:M56 family metallopeptidase, partial [Alienimonas chondri]|uniref:M56 family metallopeptidase n=1 Tax=Alienimonas chondri TaxID=2681879 RepID=UPI001487D39D